LKFKRAESIIIMMLSI